MKTIPHSSLPSLPSPSPNIFQPIGDTKMKEESKKEKKEIRIPRVAVYLVSVLVCMLIAVGFTLLFGVAYAIDCITVVAEVGVLMAVVLNISERLAAKKYHLLTSKYWVQMALILITDGLFAFTSYSTTMEILGVRGAFFLLVLIVTILFALFVYKPSVVTLMATAEENTVKGIAEILGGDEEKAKAVVAFLKNPVKEKEEEKSEE
jgi:hypothetical protein